MLYMVIEKYRHGPGPVYQRAAERGRMLPDGLRYVDSWVVDDGPLDRCFQLMETDDPALLAIWQERWADLTEFEIVPVITSAEAAARADVRWDGRPATDELAGRAASVTGAVNIISSGGPMTATALPTVVDADTWQRELDALRVREKAATRELDAIAAQRRRLPMVKMPDYTLEGEQGPVRLADVFDGKSQLIVYNHMWFPGEQWQCPGCTGFTSQFTRLEFLDSYDARFVIVTQGPIADALAYSERVGNKMTWYSTANSPFGSDVGAPPGGGFAVNVFLRDGDDVYRTWHTNGRGTEQLSHSFALIDLLPYGRQEEWQDSPDGWPQSPTYSRWSGSEAIAAAYGPGA